MRLSGFIFIFLADVILWVVAFVCFYSDWVPLSYEIPIMAFGVITGFVGGYVLLTLILMVKRGEIPSIYNKDFGRGLS
ncbi:MAG: hypothetical protein U9P50_00280 [Patescibacteria group bacterium]|nr:hypothetical protein [Patescibacteria group bacterium]